MKLLLTILSVTITLVGMAQKPISVTIEGNIFNSHSDSLQLSQFFGTYYKDYATIAIGDDGNFAYSGDLPSPDFYVLRLGTQHINLILRDSSNIKVYGDANNIDQFCNIVGSDESANMNEFTRVMDAWANKRNEAMAKIQNDPSSKAQVDQEMQKEFYAFNNTLQTFVKSNPNSPALIATLSAFDPIRDYDSYETIVLQIYSSFPESPSVQSIYTSYKGVKQQKEAADIFAPGKPAPDFEELMLDRETTMKLSDLKGQVVLIDFWASWCGPCRKANPEVVRLYEKYKDQGFTILSVSLDNDLNRWKMAIEQDNLSWPYHVSDLKKWQSAAAKLYQVRGIPHAVLIDRDGNIIQKGVNVHQLDPILAELLGK